MIDIHTHILPGVDDGAEDLMDALLMAELAAESGVHTLIATPHSSDLPVGEILQQVQKLQEKINERQIPLRLLTGMEIYATGQGTEQISIERVLPLNHTQYYLLEFGFHAVGQRITELLKNVLETGAIPVVAHPERYISVQKNPEIVLNWLDMGCQLQMNKGSIMGSFGRETFRAADTLLRNDCITYIASDAHSPYRRTTYMKDTYELIKEEFSVSMARRLFQENPEKYLL